MNLEDYQKQIKVTQCRWCTDENKNIDLSTLKVQRYDHSGGWTVDGFDKKQWLFVVCPGCEYEWSLSKLGVEREGNEKNDEVDFMEENNLGAEDMINDNKPTDI